MVNKSELWGQCKRYPPQVTQEEDTQPMTTKFDFCGEYAQAPTNLTAPDA
jgi:hypothetical protein